MEFFKRSSWSNSCFYVQPSFTWNHTKVKGSVMLVNTFVSKEGKQVNTGLVVFQLTFILPTQCLAHDFKIKRWKLWFRNQIKTKSVKNAERRVRGKLSELLIAHVLERGSCPNTASSSSNWWRSGCTSKRFNSWQRSFKRNQTEQAVVVGKTCCWTVLLKVLAVFRTAWWIFKTTARVRALADAAQKTDWNSNRRILGKCIC